MSRFQEFVLVDSISESVRFNETSVRFRPMLVSSTCRLTFLQDLGAAFTHMVISALAEVPPLPRLRLPLYILETAYPPFTFP